MPMFLLMRGTSARRTSMAARAAPCSSASAAQSHAVEPAPMHADGLAAQPGKIDVAERMHDEARIEPAKHLRRVGAAEPVAPVRQHHAARRDLARAGRRTQRQQDKLAVAADIDQFGARSRSARRSCAGTSADSPSIAGAGCDRACPIRPRRTAPRTRRGTSGWQTETPARTAPAASAASPCAPSSPTAPRSPPARDRRRAGCAPRDISARRRRASPAMPAPMIATSSTGPYCG